MFETMQLLPDDPILKLAELFRQDQRMEKVDVGVGVFQDASGTTPIMQAVKLAEEQLWQQQRSKKYLGLVGNTEFNELMTELVLGKSFDNTRTRALQSVAGTGALRLIAELLAKENANLSVWIPKPTWGNHRSIFAMAGLEVMYYPYYDFKNAMVDEAGLYSTLMHCKKGDVVVLHGCCHNPCGADLTPTQWHEITDIILSRGIIPVIDLAYMGFGHNLEEDVYGLRYLSAKVDYALLAVSCSKNFGLYRERTGLVIAIAANAERARAMQSQLAGISRSLVSMAPDHGAAIVASILSDSRLKQIWQDELAEMAKYIRSRRIQFRKKLEQQTDESWASITAQQGMFSILPLGTDTVVALRENFGIYMVGSGRINFAGLKNEADTERVASIIAKKTSTNSK